MSRATGIEWTDATWNPIRGCSRVSEGRRNCYAETVANRFCKPGSPYEGVVQIGADGKGLGKWNGQIKFVEKHLLDPLRWKKPQRIFVNSMSDLFHENVTDEMLDKIFAVMALCPEHTFQVLTKRPGRMHEYVAGHWQSRLIPWLRQWQKRPEGWGVLLETENGVLPNVWLGVSVENQKAADERIPLLLKTPAAKKFLSVEPLLEGVSLDSNVGGTRWIGGQRGCEGQHHGNGSPDCPRHLHHHHDDRCKPGLDWVIVGGESGPGARPMHPAWARSLRDQCVEAGVPFFFKQWGEWAPGAQQADYSRKGAAYTRIDIAGNPSNDPTKWLANDRLFYRVGKHAAGRLLDGREWNEMPA